MRISDWSSDVCSSDLGVRVLWTPEAEQDRADIWDYIVADNPSAAVQIDQLFSEAATRLAEFPMLGHAGRIPGTRELIPQETYRLVYEIDNREQTVRVLALVHTARQWPSVKENRKSNRPDYSQKCDTRLPTHD